MKSSKLITPTTLALAIALVFITAQSLMAQDSEQEIAWKLSEGDTFDVTFDQESVVTSEFNSLERVVGTQMQLTMEWNVAGVDENALATIEQTITRIGMTMSTPAVGAGAGKTIEIDTTMETEDVSDKVARNMLTQILPLVDATFTVTMQPSGQVDSVTATRETMDVLRQVPGSMQMRELLTPEGLKQLFGQSLVVLPKSTFDAGEKWDGSRQSETPMGIFTSSDKYTFVGDAELEGQSFTKISVASTTELTTPAENTETELTEATGEGALYFDADAGHFVNSRFTTKFATSQEYRDSAINLKTVSNVQMQIQKK